MSQQTWVITGGAGYVGSHIADLFLASNKEIVIFDIADEKLNSRIEYLRKKYNVDIPFVQGDIRDVSTVDQMLGKYKPYGVIHTAALKSVSESIKRPDEYNAVNLQATSYLLTLLNKHKVHNYIFSSTAAVYGSPNHNKPVNESEIKNPISPYGLTKLEAEKIATNFFESSGNFGTSLRFFNVVGTSSAALADDSTANLVPIVINKLNNDEPVIIFGTDFDTKDGTCVRDYVDVRDVAAAHLACANFNSELPHAMNVGTGQGASVREIIELVATASGKGKVRVIEDKRREGDPAFLCADVTLIRETIGFQAQYSIKQSIESLF
jgi:UDP-glucose 4-epimerase